LFLEFYEDGVCWIFRIGKRSPLEGQAHVLQSEYYSMKYIKEHTTIPLPEVYDFNIEYNHERNPVCSPYLMMEALGGRTLSGEFENVIPLEHQDKLLSQLADYREQLSSLRFPKIGNLNANEAPVIS
jgi:hypothetical protein